MNTSATGGVLLPTGAVADDDALDAIFQALISQVTGLDGSLVRPRWQPTPPKQPEPKVNWCALGVSTQEGDAGPWIAYDPVADNTDYWRHEGIDVLSSFYGPNAQGMAKMLRDGLSIPQNTESLLPIRFTSNGPIRQVPELVNQQWIRRADLALTFRRKVMRTYAITHLVSANVQLIDDTVIDELISYP
jgi:hypothetical protein